MKHFSFQILILIFSYKLSYTQVSNGYDTQLNFNQFVNTGAGSQTVVRQMKPMSHGIEGSPYYSERFIKGKIQIKGQVFYPVDINLDLIDNNLLAIRDRKSSPLVLDKGAVELFSFEFYPDSIVHFKKILVRNIELFVQLVAKNNTTEIYLNRVKRIRKADNSGPYSRGLNYDQIYEEFEYFRKDLLTNEVQLIDTRKRNLPHLFPGEEAKVSGFLKLNSFSIREVQGLNSFFVYMIESTN